MAVSKIATVTLFRVLLPLTLLGGKSGQSVTCDNMHFAIDLIVIQPGVQILEYGLAGYICYPTAQFPLGE